MPLLVKDLDGGVKDANPKIIKLGITKTDRVG